MKKILCHITLMLLLFSAVMPVNAQMEYSRGGRTIAPAPQQQEENNMWKAVVPGVVVVVALGAANHFLKKKKEDYKKTH